MEIFRAVMTTGSVTKAARHLNISQPAVSKQLRRVEDVLGFRLFKRENGRLRPTAEAKELHPAVDRIFANVDAVSKIAQDLRDMKTGLIRIATTPSLGMTYLPPVISSFVRDRPGVHIGFKILNAEQTVERTVNRQVDLGFLQSPVNDAGLAVDAICDASVVCAMPASHPLARMDVVEPRMLADERLISVNRASVIGALIDDAFTRAGLLRDSVVEVSHSFIAFSLVESCAGIAVIDPLVQFERFFPNVVVRPFQPRIRIDPKIIYPSTSPLSRLNESFVTHMKEVIGCMAVSDRFETE